MKRNLLIAFVLLISITSCKKEKPPVPESEDRKPEVIINEITSKLAGADSISVFTAALKNIALTSEETAQGITVFAPLNQSPDPQGRIGKMASVGGGRGNGSRMGKLSETSPTDTTKKVVLTNSELRDHIVKGVFNFADLTNGRVLTGLNGNQLKVTRLADTVWINGIRIGGQQIISSSNEAVYAVKSILTGTTVNDEPQSDAYTEVAFDANFSIVESNLAAWHKKLVLIDALLSRQAVTDSIPSIFNTMVYQSVSNFSFNPSNSLIEEIWRKGYESIATLSVLQDRIPNVMTDRSIKLARVRAMRAYIYLQLLTYYGNISVLQTTGNLNNQNRAAVYAYITKELQEAAAVLPSGGNTPIHLNALSVRALSARAALLDKKYAEAAELAESVINAGKYALAVKGNEFNVNSSEIMWDNSVGMDPNIKSFFFSRPSLPYLRLTEVYLMAAEANSMLNNLTKAQSFYAVVAQRSGYSVGTGDISFIRALWPNEMRREGNVFSSMLRWNTAALSLSSLGFVVGKHSRLPIPQNIMDANSQMMQNPGY